MVIFRYRRLGCLWLWLWLAAGGTLGRADDNAGDSLTSATDVFALCQQRAQGRRATLDVTSWLRTVQPEPVTNAVAWVSETNTAWDVRVNVLEAQFVFPPSTGTNGPAGNYGDLYDNRDRGHSTLPVANHPGLSRVAYAPEARQAGCDYGLQTRLLFNAVTIGNASLANTQGPFWRSMPRIAYPDSALVWLLALQYANNHVYVYPEHNDHDPERGDVFCANTPYVLISQGSSGSDRPFLEALASTLAAFEPATKARLRQERALAPALQMILRACGRSLTEPAAYRTGIAHPTVFEAGFLDVPKMTRMAAAMTPTNLPPLVQLRMVSEDQPKAGVDYCDVTGTERIFDTPQAIARVVRGMGYERRMVVSAAASRDLDGRPLRWHWAVLRGDAKRIQINPRAADGSEVELVVPYHSREELNACYPIPNYRVDIGVFVNNGEYDSAPGFISFYFLPNETRVYDQQQRMQSVTYCDGGTNCPYADPLLDRPKNWRDDYQYDAAGKLTGWTRRRGETTVQFNAAGERLTSSGAAEPVRYEVTRRPDGTVGLQEVGAAAER